MLDNIQQKEIQPPIPGYENAVSIETLAKLWDVCDRTVANWIANGCPHRKAPGREMGKPRSVRLFPSEVKSWMDKHHFVQRRKSINRSLPARRRCRGLRA